MNIQQLKKGNTVTSYLDPITCRRAEGEVTLLELLNIIPIDDKREHQEWKVEFLDDKYKRTRFFLAEK